MNRYLDTSFIVASWMNEAASVHVRAWLAAQDLRELMISDWVVTEVSSALSIKLRTGQITLDHRATALGVFNQMISSSLLVVPVTTAHFRAAAALTDRYDLGLRASDALHLAVCAEHGATLMTLDQKLAKAGPAVGVSTSLA